MLAISKQIFRGFNKPSVWRIIQNFRHTKRVGDGCCTDPILCHPSSVNVPGNSTAPQSSFWQPSCDKCSNDIACLCRQRFAVSLAVCRADFSCEIVCRERFGASRRWVQHRKNARQFSLHVCGVSAGPHTFERHVFVDHSERCWPTGG